MSARNPFPMRRPRPVTATGLVDFLVEGVYPVQEAHLRHYGAVEYARRLAAGGVLRAGGGDATLRLPSAPVMQSVQLVAGDYAVHLNWKKAKVVYDVEPTMMSTLAEMDTHDLLPGGILRQLPHPNPVFVFTEGHPVMRADGMSALVRAMYVSGRRADQTMCDTSDREAAEYQLTFKCDLLDGSGQVIDMDSVRISVGVLDDSFTMRATIDAVLKDYVWEPLMSDTSSAADKRLHMEALAHFGIAHLLYVCSEKADMVRKPIGRKPVRKGGRRPERPLQLRQVGWRIGPAIKATRDSIATSREATGTGSGRTVAPHVRRAHLHTFRYGKERALSKVRWLPPTFVNAGGEQISIDATIVPVRA
ncbi:hypothetical protein ACIP5U_38995 [Streptomyces sp. NPDC088788]|uniref:hypothetical protein n=1 Tax=Streptomyces sp. NPDC088788 TaxID=3365898 RepID=UPI00380E35DC